MFDLSEVQPSSWSLPLGLTSFVLQDCSVRTFPAAVCTLPQLQDLRISDSRYFHGTGTEITAFPAGPYLHHLQTLEVNLPKLGHEALAHATKLQEIVIVGEVDANPFWTCNALESPLPKGCEVIFI